MQSVNLNNEVMSGRLSAAPSADAFTATGGKPIGVAPHRVSDRFGNSFAGVLGVAFLYIATAKLGFLLAIHPGNVTAVWPPSGIALAALLIGGNRLWPGIWLGSFVANTWVFKGMAAGGVDFAVGTSIGVGSVLQAAAGASALRVWIGGNDPLGRTVHVFRFLLVAMAMCVISSTFGVASLCAAKAAN